MPDEDNNPMPNEDKPDPNLQSIDTRMPDTDLDRPDPNLVSPVTEGADMERIEKKGSD